MRMRMSTIDVGMRLPVGDAIDPAGYGIRLGDLKNKHSNTNMSGHRHRCPGFCFLRILK